MFQHLPRQIIAQLLKQMDMRICGACFNGVAYEIVSTTSSSLSATGVDKERGTNRSTFSVMRCCSAFSGAYTPINVLNVQLRRNKRRQSLKSGNIKRNTSISFISMKFNTRTSTRLPLPETTARAH